MASGKKNYFRHSFFAGNDDKIVNLISEHGKQAYFHYFRLLELCGQQASESIPEKFIFHRRTLCAELMVTNSRLGHHLLAMQSSLLLHYVLTDRKVEILIPNFPKYLGKYQNKKSPNCSNKRKEKKRKKNIYSKKFFDFEKLVKCWNAHKKLLQCVLNDETQRLIENALQKKPDATFENIAQAISNYAWVLENSNFFTHRWTLWDFLQRDNTNKFFPDNFVRENWVKTKNDNFYPEARSLQAKIVKLSAYSKRQEVERCLTPAELDLVAKMGGLRRLLMEISEKNLVHYIAKHLQKNNACAHSEAQ